MASMLTRGASRLSRQRHMGWMSAFGRSAVRGFAATSDDAKSKYCVCDSGYYAIKTAGVWNCAACEGATGSRIPQESGEDAKCTSTLKAAAEKSRAALLDDIADESLKKKAQLLADAAIAPVRR